MSIFNLFHRRKKEVQMSIFPELLLLFPEGKKQFGEFLIKTQNLFNKDAKYFSTYLISITHDLFFDKSLAENEEAISQRILSSKDCQLTAPEAQYLAKYILTEVQSASPEQKMKYVDTVMRKTLANLGVSTDEMPKHNVPIHPHFSDESFADFVQHHARIQIFEKDDADGLCLGWIEHGSIKIITGRDKGPIGISSLIWLARLYEQNKKLYWDLYNSINTPTDMSIASKQSYISRRTFNEIQFDNDRVLSDVYSLLHFYCRFSADYIQPYWTEFVKIHSNIIKQGLTLTDYIIENYPTSKNVQFETFPKDKYIFLIMRDFSTKDSKENI